MSESEWLARIKADPSVFSEVFQQYFHPIFGYIFRRTGNFDDAADIPAETFLNAFRHIHRFTYQGISIKVWLYQIATNEIDRRRQCCAGKPKARRAARSWLLIQHSRAYFANNRIY